MWWICVIFLIIGLSYWLYRRFYFGKFSSDYQKIKTLLRNYPLVQKVFIENDWLPNYYPLESLWQVNTLAVTSGALAICTDMTPQGLAVSQHFILLSAYCHSFQHCSLLLLFDRYDRRLLKTVPLSGRPHVGGLAIDVSEEKIWLTLNNGNVATIGLADLLAFPDQATEPIAYEKVYDLPEIPRAAYLAIHDQELIVGTFEKEHQGFYGRYALENLESPAVKKGAIVSKAQAITFYQDYCLVAQSFGPRSSHVYLFSMAQFEQGDLVEAAALVTLKFPPYLEQITVFQDQLYLVFESGASAYRQKTRPIEAILVLSLKSLMPSIS